MAPFVPMKGLTRVRSIGVAPINIADCRLIPNGLAVPLNPSRVMFPLFDLMTAPSRKIPSLRRLLYWEGVPVPLRVIEPLPPVTIAEVETEIPVPVAPGVDPPPTARITMLPPVGELGITELNSAFPEDPADAPSPVASIAVSKILTPGTFPRVNAGPEAARSPPPPNGDIPTEAAQDRSRPNENVSLGSSHGPCG